MARTAILFAVLLIVAESNHAENIRDKVNHMKKIKMAFFKLFHLHESHGEPQGTPFPPLVSKPFPNQRVAIVGAGLAGLHMAYLMKKKNFTNVAVLEKDSRFGGKLMSVQHNGVVHEMGACFTSPDYILNVYELARELGVNDFVPSSSGTVWLDRLNFPMNMANYIITEVKRLTGAKSTLHAVENLVNAAYRYTSLHRRMFGKYKGDLMLKPSREVLSQLNQTMLSFLTKHNLLALAPVLTAVHTMQGYGHLDRISALYGMIWDTPNFLIAAIVNYVESIARALCLNTRSRFDMFRDGFMQLTDKLASMTDVRLNVNIEKVERDSNGITIRFSNATHSNVAENFDHLIWAADAREALRVFDSTTLMEKSFSRLKNTWFTTTLFDSTEHCISPTPVDWWVSNANKKREHSIWVRINSKFAINGERCNTTTADVTDMSSVSYQMGDSSPLGSSIVETKFQQHFVAGLGAKDVNIIKKRTWNYFPRFSVKEMADGILWKIAERQGERNTWFVGASVSFESTKSVIEYNKLMMERMML